MAERLRIARESVSTSQGFVREIDGEIAGKKAMLAGSQGEGRLAASNAGLAMLARDKRDLATRVADLVGLVQEAGKLNVVFSEIQRIDPESARIVAACSRSGLRRDAPPEESLRSDGPLGPLLTALASLSDIATPLDTAAEDMALRARAQEKEAHAPLGRSRQRARGRRAPLLRHGHFPRRTRPARDRGHADLRTRRNHRSEMGTGSGGPARRRPRSSRRRTGPAE